MEPAALMRVLDPTDRFRVLTRVEMAPLAVEMACQVVWGDHVGQGECCYDGVIDEEKRGYCKGFPGKEEFVGGVGLFGTDSESLDLVDSGTGEEREDESCCGDEVGDREGEGSDV